MATLIHESRRVLALLVLGGLLGTGCAPQLAGPPPPAPSQAKIQKNRVKRVPARQIVAPPPAWGNKIVMAKARAETTTF
jgi:hypothetical protein